MSDPQEQLDPAIQEELVAYLDGELDAQGSRRIEEMLANDPRVRAALQRLDRTWDLLDELDTPPVRDGFTRTTLEMVAVAAAKDVDEAKVEAPRRRRRGRLLAMAALAVAGLAGFLAVAALTPNPNRQLLQDLPLLEDLDQYRQVDGIEFLRSLENEKLFTVEGDAGAAEGAESLAERRERIKNMSPAQKDQLLSRQRQFQKLDPAERQRVRALHDQLDRDPDGERLRNVLAHYCQWFAGLPTFRQAELRDAPPAERIKTVRKIQAAEAARQLGAEDRQALLQWIDRYVRQHEARLVDMLPPLWRQQFSGLSPEVRHTRVLASVYRRWKTANAASLAMLGAGELAELRQGLSPQVRARLAAKPPAEQWQIVAEWIRQAAREQVTVRRKEGSLLPDLDEQLLHYFESRLSDQDRDYLMSLPGDDMQQRLRMMVDRYQHVKRPAGHAPRPEKTGKAEKPPEKDAAKP